ncbi:DUF2336 domain-containing protein [Rhizobium tumorigenes]|uniref:DUF2336 domain-containing protein n=1 Tax=Rhizobium tumorigenes TaxID=2041385 RepID=UPI00241F6896|nr:DUF2336 domain-containing protein [Rhizobium tumorigenes]WFS01726.1 hypothetical protein PR016_03590 [Rhizobium tumorigenes]
MRDRFRDLEGPLGERKKDVVLMATVSSFEERPHPGKSELRQFAELFMPLFLASSDEAKRQAVAALSQCPHVPPAVALFIGCQPIAIAAPFIAAAGTIDDDTLITIARTQGTEHAKAIVKRDNLSPAVVDALVGLRHADTGRGKTKALETPQTERIPLLEAPDSVIAERLAREEALRQQLRQIARHLSHDDTDRLGLRSLTDIQEALLVRFAREREAQNFATALADALSSSRWLAERILLDLSGQQLAVTLTSLGMNFADGVFVLERFYPHLSDGTGSISRAWRIMDSVDPADSQARVETWRRADRYTYVTPDQARPANHFKTRKPEAENDVLPARARGGAR